MGATYPDFFQVWLWSSPKQLNHWLAFKSHRVFFSTLFSEVRSLILGFIDWLIGLASEALGFSYLWLMCWDYRHVPGFLQVLRIWSWVLTLYTASSLPTELSSQPECFQFLLRLAFHNLNHFLSSFWLHQRNCISLPWLWSYLSGIFSSLQTH